MVLSHFVIRHDLQIRITVWLTLVVFLPMPEMLPFLHKIKWKPLFFLPCSIKLSRPFTLFVADGF
ncbi:hypothetical protein BO94DRAFT_28663 [Aspergillus sclerotioniger CBS 115572]|uniref:Uncharacterized protein n=1 Tax=Aspergillus sclerotioniger CBS 115572 TaxID=1450535 RepID=A0A317WW23_9EURO|nr:hypothetical protein BO94DRAFT_28663 [Aspergillus sclerotioniger CBS 115572]PWY90543.1 hypothetical protein BO94DRAFT_28663 [Aspergillus sclerotioniger CBS 115572]